MKGFFVFLSSIVRPATDLARDRTTTVSLIAFILFSSAAHVMSSPRDISVFGDSLSSPSYSWLEQINRLEYAQMRNMAVAGSMLVATEIPRQLNCHTTDVILWSGTNDAGANINLAWYERSLNDKLAFLETRGCTVWLGLPVQLDISEGWADTREYRKIGRKLAQRYQNTRAVNVPYNQEQTLDGLHPTEEQHAAIAEFWIRELKL